MGKFEAPPSDDADRTRLGNTVFSVDDNGVSVGRRVPIIVLASAAIVAFAVVLQQSAISCHVRDGVCRLPMLDRIGDGEQGIYTGFTLPFLLPWGMLLGSAAQLAISIVIIGVCAARKTAKIPPRPWMFALWAFVSSVLRMLALFVIAQFALMIPGVWAGRVSGAPLTYGLAIVPVAWKIWTWAWRATGGCCIAPGGCCVRVRVAELEDHVQSFGQLIVDDSEPSRRYHRGNVPVEHVSDSLFADADRRASIKKTREDEVPQRALGYVQWILTVLIGLNILLIVRTSDFFPDAEPRIPYYFAALISAAAATVWSLADVLLLSTCRATVTRYARTSTCARFADAAMISTASAISSVVALGIVILSIYLPHITRHGLFDIGLNSEDKVVLSGPTGILTIAAVWAVLSMSQILVYKLANPIAWVFGINVAIWVLSVVGTRSFVLYQPITGILSIGLWILLNITHVVAHGRDMKKRDIITKGSYATIVDDEPIGHFDDIEMDQVDPEKDVPSEEPVILSDAMTDDDASSILADVPRQFIALVRTDTSGETDL